MQYNINPYIYITLILLSYWTAAQYAASNQKIMTTAKGDKYNFYLSNFGCTDILVRSFNLI